MDAFDPVVRLCHFTNRQAADYCGVSIDTIQRWRRTGRPTPAALKLLAIAAGYVPWPAWQGWEMHGDYLFPPGYSRNGILPGNFWSYPYTFQLADELERTVEAQKARIEDLEASSSPVYR